MGKLRLDMAELKVESFDTFVAEGRRGTVRANSGCVTYSCPGTCGASPPSDMVNVDLWGATLTHCVQCACA